MLRTGYRFVSEMGFWMTGRLNPNSSEVGRIFFNHVRCVPRPWGFASGQQFHVSLNQFLREFLRSQIEESQKEKGACLS